MGDLTKKQKSIMYLANRHCGISYRAGCNRDRDGMLELKNRGLIWLNDNGKDRGRFIFRTTEKGKSLADENGRF